MVAILTDPELLRRQHLLQGAVEARVLPPRRGEEEITVEVETDEPRRTMRGVDKSRTDPSRTVYSWNLPGRTCQWRYRGTWGERVAIDGTIRVQPEEAACRVSNDISVKVSVPLIGTVIEKRIAQEIQAGFGPFEELLRQFCSESEGTKS
jgi:hypothetical protein